MKSSLFIQIGPLVERIHGMDGEHHVKKFKQSFSRYGPSFFSFFDMLFSVPPFPVFSSFLSVSDGV